MGVISINLDNAFQELIIELTIWSKGSFDFATDLFASIDIFQDDFFESAEVFVSLNHNEECFTSLRRLLNPYDVSSILELKF